MKKSNELRSRIIEFTLSVIKMTRLLSKNSENIIFTNQLLRAVSSIGANYSECMFAHTKAEFIHIMSICRKETNETLYWFEIIARSNPGFKKELDVLLDEGEQLLKIFVASIKTARRNTEK